jgi:tetratricopeptide (TPR) repeat protein
VALRENVHVAESRQLLLDATEDEYRLVRVRAAGALGAFPRPMLGEKDRKRLETAESELVASLQARPDDWSSHYNLGSFYSDRGDLAQALRHYELAGKFRPDAVPPLVNASIVYAQVGQAGKAEESLLKALAISPANAAAHFNMGLLKAELGDAGKAEEHLRAALKFEPTMAEAAHNLGILLAQSKPKESLEWCARAWQLRPGEARYGYTLAFYLDRAGNPQGAAEILRTLIDRQPGYVDAYLLLGAIHERLGQAEQAKTVYQRAARIEGLSPRQRQAIEQRLRR